VADFTCIVKWNKAEQTGSIGKVNYYKDLLEIIIFIFYYLLLSLYNI